ncbi:hypothetical protein [Sutterella wadsworthensis]|nr:hypothetical protein [Sutterella wadsworthensis]
MMLLQNDCRRTAALAFAVVLPQAEMINEYFNAGVFNQVTEV